MKFKKTMLLGVFVLIANALSAQKTIELNGKFNKIIISPHIETVFIKGDTPSIELTELLVAEEKFKYELTNNTLQIYLEDARTYTKRKKNTETGVNSPLYKGRVAKVVVTYTDIVVFSVRGEEKTVFESPIEQEKCSFRFFGQAEVLIKNINVDELVVDIYGNSFLTIEKGTIKKQKIRAYGASTIMASEIEARETRMTAYGDGNYQINASEKLRIDAYGQAKILYKGEATFKKGIVIGDSTIRKMD